MSQDTDRTLDLKYVSQGIFFWGFCKLPTRLVNVARTRVSDYGPQPRDLQGRIYSCKTVGHRAGFLDKFDRGRSRANWYLCICLRTIARSGCKTAEAVPDLQIEGYRGCFEREKGRWNVVVGARRCRTCFGKSRTSACARDRSRIGSERIDPPLRRVAHPKAPQGLVPSLKRAGTVEITPQCLLPDSV